MLVSSVTIPMKELRMNDFPVPPPPMTIAHIGLYAGSFVMNLTTVSTAEYTVDLCSANISATLYCAPSFFVGMTKLLAEQAWSLAALSFYVIV